VRSSQRAPERRWGSYQLNAIHKKREASFLFILLLCTLCAPSGWTQEALWSKLGIEVLGLCRQGKYDDAVAKGKKEVEYGCIAHKGCVQQDAGDF